MKRLMIILLLVMIAGVSFGENGPTPKIIVGSSGISDGSVTPAKLADDAVTASKVSETGSFTMKALSLGTTGIKIWHSNFDRLAMGNEYAAVAGDSFNARLEMVNNAYASGAAEWKYKASLAGTRYSQQLGNHKFYVAVSGSTNATITWIPALSLDISGQTVLHQVPEFTDQAAAVAGGLATGTVYHTAGVLKIVTP